jgi:hypothetical protein
LLGVAKRPQRPLSIQSRLQSPTAFDATAQLADFSLSAQLNCVMSIRQRVRRRQRYLAFRADAAAVPIPLASEGQESQGHIREMNRPITSGALPFPTTIDLTLPQSLSVGPITASSILQSLNVRFDQLGRD